MIVLVILTVAGIIAAFMLYEEWAHYRHEQRWRNS